MDYTHAPKEVTVRTLACHDAEGRVTLADGWRDLEVLGVMALYAWIVAMVGLTIYRLVRGRWWKEPPPANAASARSRRSAHAHDHRPPP
jgi:hypothetical protein